MEDKIIKDILKNVGALYDKNDYQGAIHLLEKNKIHVSPGVWHYNLGTLYAKLENFPISRYHFMMADLKGYSEKSLFNNKKIVEEKLEIEGHEQSHTLTDYLIKGSIEASYGLLTTLSMMMLVSGIFVSFRKSNLKLLKFWAFASVLILIFNFWVQSWKKGIIIESQILHDGPSSLFISNNELPLGLMIVVLEKDDWLKIVFPSRYRGWIKNNGIRILE